ncbi:DUF2971 domain-containing protein [Salinivibrio sp. IB872]|uniref:DUF2971 domain-containing protein n=1 Tax=Salinivibrio sp. IB872 TaxID=1766123 RepID=UPI000984CD61|nr:DUF2971 domain-containing protein [Salinivibrio sp. IB872]OOF25717.1 hypothetical protein BZJ18_10930 [Salinivibrio sp. IB872]
MNELIYHYTSADTFLSIVKGKSLWATDASKLNDPNEYTLGISILKEAITDYNKNDFMSSIKDKGLRRFESVVEDFLGRSTDTLQSSLSEGPLSNSFICSFSNDGGDSLSQWRSYADDGAGFAIGINRDTLINIKDSKIFDVSYSKKELVKNVYSSLRLMVLNMNSGYSIKYPLDDVKWRSSRELEILAYSFKDVFYQSEKEVRLVNFSKPSEMSYRITNYGIAPYIEIDITDSIHEVVLGPKCKNSETEIKSLLENLGLAEVHVRRSAGDYR